MRKRRTQGQQAAASGVSLWAFLYAFRSLFWRGLKQSYYRPVNRLPETRYGGLFTGLNA